MKNSYVYQPLDLFTDEIRLLTLHPGHDGDGISCTLSHHNLMEDLKYEALSYAWGENVSLCRINVDGITISVTANLEAALHHLRYQLFPTPGQDKEIRPTGDRVLWVDALCINQQDPSERGHQVRRMGKIFSSAWRVVAWLGEASHDSDTAMDFVRMIEQGLGLFNEYGEPLSPKEKWLALHNLWARPYWGRVWIIQELASAMVKEKPVWIPRYHAEIGCGRKWLRLNIFQNAWNYLNKYLNQPLVRGKDEYVPVRNLFTLLFEHAHRRLSLSALISLTYTANATDARDHFYAILGLAPESDQRALVPDYTKSLKDICGQFIKHIIEKENKLDILTFGHSSPGADLPTWAPNFESLSRSASIRWRPYWKNFWASGKDGIHRPRVRFSNHLTTLVVGGFMVDRIVTVDGPFVGTQDFIQKNSSHFKASFVKNAKRVYRFKDGVKIKLSSSKNPVEDGMKLYLKRLLDGWWLQWFGDMRNRQGVWRRRSVLQRRNLQRQWDIEYKIWERELYQLKQQWEPDISQQSSQYLYVPPCPDLYAQRHEWKQGKEWEEWEKWVQEVKQHWKQQEGQQEDQQSLTFAVSIAPPLPELIKTSLFNYLRQVLRPRYEEEPLMAVGRTITLDHHLEESPPIAKRGIPDTFRLLYQLLLDPINEDFRTESRGLLGLTDIVSSIKVELEEKRCFDLSIQQALENRCFFTTSSGYIGVGPRDTLCDDYVAVFLGGNMPFIVRDKSTHHSLVGEAYVHGIMNGELMASWMGLEEFHLK